MRRFGSVGLGALVVVAWAMVVPAGASAQRHRPKDGAAHALRLAPFVGAGFGGEAKFDASGAFGISFSGHVDLQPTATFGFIADYPVYTYVAVGLLARAQFLHFDNVNDHASTALDISAMIRGRYPFKNGEVYLAVPVGFSEFWVNDDADPTVGQQLDGGPGWNVALLFGGQFLVTKKIGIFAHMGGQFRGSKHDFTGGDVKIRTKQFVMEAGVAFLL